MPDEPESPARLLVQALNELKPDERDQVLAWLFDRIPNATIATASALKPELQKGLGHRWGQFAVAQEQLLANLGDFTRKDLRMVPVRVPVELHARLQDWCKEHNFSMATVIRGLLARFLDEQGQPPRAEPS